MEWTTAASLAFRLGKQSFDNRHTIQKYWSTAKAFLDIGKTQIIITGHGNAGKTLLCAQMHGRARDLAYETPAESRSIEVDAITLGDWTKLIRVLPGQTSYRVPYEIETFEDNDSLEGVIHVVDFGHVKPRDPVVSEALVKNDGLNTIEKLITANLQSELQTLQALLTDIRKAHHKHKKPKWLVIAVNKIDLFHNQRVEALHHYHPNGNGSFGKILQAFQHELGQRNFEVYILQVCAHETDFTWNQFTINSNLRKQQQFEILREFVRTIASISEIHNA